MFCFFFLIFFWGEGLGLGFMCFLFRVFNCSGFSSGVPTASCVVQWFVGLGFRV